MNRRRASVLIGLLWCVALLAVAVVSVLHTARMDLLTEKGFGDKIQARYLALAGVEKAEALLYQNAVARSRSKVNHSGDLYNDSQDFQSVKLGRGTYSVLHRAGEESGGGVVYGISDEESRLNLNTANQEQLTQIEGLDSDVASAILGWRGSGNRAAENDYYLSLVPPYQARGGAFETVRELLMVRGVSPSLFFGRDTRMNGLLNDVNDDPRAVPQYPVSASANDLGWAGMLTVNSGIKNVDAAGESRVNVQKADENSLASVSGITREMASAIVSYRKQHRLQNIADLLDVTPPSSNNNRNSRYNRNSQSSSEGESSTVISEDVLMQIADNVTASDDDTLSGRININTASTAVLLCLPGMDRNLAQAIISHRDSSGYFANIAELLKVDGMTREIFKQLAPLVCARSETYRILAEGRISSTGVRQRIQVIARVNLDGVKTLSYREDNL